MRKFLKHNFVEWLLMALGFDSLEWNGLRRRARAYAPAVARQTGRSLVAFIASLAVFSTASAQEAADRHVQLSGTGARSDVALRDLGMVTAWRTQLQLPIQNGQIVSTHLWALPDAKRTFAEVTLPPTMIPGGRTFRASADRLGSNGEPVGLEGAKKDVLAQALLALRRREPSLTPVEVTYPVVYLVVVSSDGYVQNYDAETGELLWGNVAGSVKDPAAAASVSDAGVCVAQGTSLYLYDWKAGAAERRPMQRASTSGVALAGNVAFTSSLSGQVAAYRFDSDPEMPNRSLSQPWTYRLFGRCLTSPASSDRSTGLVAFATATGKVTVLSALGRIEPWFNVDARAPLAGPISFSGNALYCGDVSGQVSKVALERTGRVEWRMILGSALNAPVLAVGGRVYLVTEVGELFCLDEKTGLFAWESGPVQGIRSVLSISKDRVFCRSSHNQLIVLDAKTGDRVFQTSASVVGADVVNQINDRLYLISEGGQIKCLHQKEMALPVFHSPPPSTPGKAKPKATGEEAVEPMQEGEAAPDPFGASENASAAGAEPMGAPAAGEAPDPFAAPAAPAAGGAANPFN